MDIQKYERVMERIKGRVEYVNSIYSHAESLGRVSVFMVESICLQLRMAIEDIAVACIIANLDEIPKVPKKLRNQYSPTRILKYLEDLNSECYPTPMVENMEGSHGKFRDINERPDGDWLTKAEATKEYGRLSEFIHQNLKYYENHPINLMKTYQHTKVLRSKIINLLSHHHITVLDEHKMYRVIMSNSSDGKVQVAEFERLNITEEEFKRMITSESLKTD